MDRKTDKGDFVRSSKSLMVLASAAALTFGAAACGDDDENSGYGGSDGGLSGQIRVDGSSTVAPLTEAIAEQFQAENPDVKVTVGTSGTGGGFEKFCAGETDISDASRAIEPDEVEACKQNGVVNEEVRVATDALTVVVNPENPLNCLTVDQLNQVWGPDSEIGSWSDVEGLRPPYDEELQLFGPGTDSGTFDYFTESVNGEEGASRKDYNNVGENDNATVTGVQGAPGGMGYFGYSFYTENQDTLKALEVDGGDGCVAPSVETAQNGTYAPLSRPLFIYPSKQSLARPEVKAFVDYYLDNVDTAAEAVGFIPLTDQQLQQSKTAAGKLG
ncbi:MAG: PstS family phosphate ABC transporter substrate-binding protein [Solirubrobacterales bacterium]